jgi:hypothetical protein
MTSSNKLCPSRYPWFLEMMSLIFMVLSFTPSPSIFLVLNGSVASVASVDPWTAVYGRLHCVAIAVIVLGFITMFFPPPPALVSNGSQYCEVPFLAGATDFSPLQPRQTLGPTHSIQ